MLSLFPLPSLPSPSRAASWSWHTSGCETVQNSPKSHRHASWLTSQRCYPLLRRSFQRKMRRVLPAMQANRCQAHSNRPPVCHTRGLWRRSSCSGRYGPHRPWPFPFPAYGGFPRRRLLRQRFGRAPNAASAVCPKKAPRTASPKEHTHTCRHSGLRPEPLRPAPISRHHAPRRDHASCSTPAVFVSPRQTPEPLHSRGGRPALSPSAAGSAKRHLSCHAQSTLRARPRSSSRNRRGGHGASEQPDDSLMDVGEAIQ